MPDIRQLKRMKRDRSNALKDITITPEAKPLKRRKRDL